MSSLEDQDIEAYIDEMGEFSDNLVVNINIFELKDPMIDLSQINMEINVDAILNINDKQYRPVSNEAVYNSHIGENGAYQIVIEPIKN